MKSNPGKWFKPAGCITTTVAGNVATHVFKDCTGPYGLVSFNGTVTSTYVRGAGTLTDTHATTGLKANGASISGSRVVAYTKTATGYSKHRTGNWSGTTKNGKNFSHTADFTVTWDPATKCITRDGKAETTVAAREFSHTVSNFKRCGVGVKGCPVSGTIVLERTKFGTSANITIELLGGVNYTITGPKGRTATLKLACTP